MLGKERMILDLLRAIHSQPSGRVAVEQLRQEGARFGAHVVGETQRVREDFAVHFVGVFVVEGWKAGQLLGVSMVW